MEDVLAHNDLALSFMTGYAGGVEDVININYLLSNAEESLEDSLVDFLLEGDDAMYFFDIKNHTD